MISLEKCPVCNNEGEYLYSLKSDFIRTQLQQYYNEPVSEDITIIDYDMLRCRKCSLEYAMPMQAGTDQFYAWITNHCTYYPNIRWEWQVVLDAIKTKKVSDIHLLEIGCGAGDFLELAKKIDTLKVIGIDLTKASVDQCRHKGLKVYCETVEDYSVNCEHNIKNFDFVVAFHTLEHIPDPKGFIASLLALLKPSGSIFLSTPYSPMSFESSWFDPLNHPPHHLTRLNTKSFKELAQQLGMNINFFMPNSGSIFYRTLNSLNLQFNGNITLSFKKVFVQALIRPFKFTREILRQLMRMKVNNKIAADVVLVELKSIGV